MILRRILPPWGFRGEALASIGSVSLTLTSKRRGEEEVWQVLQKGRNQGCSISPAAHTGGRLLRCGISLQHARSPCKFLKAEKPGLGHLEEVLKRQALAAFDTGFTLSHNQRILHQLRPAKQCAGQGAVSGAICGKPFLESAVTIDVEASGLKLGWLGEYCPTFSLQSGRFTILLRQWTRNP